MGEFRFTCPASTSTTATWISVTAPAFPSSHYLQTTVSITTLGVLSHSALLGAIDALGSESVVSSVDYLYGSSVGVALHRRTREAWLAASAILFDGLSPTSHRGDDA
jgi:hypothetical protein